MLFRKLTSLLTLLLLFFAIPLVHAEDFKDFAELNLEELLNTEIYSASRRVQQLKDAPNAIFVLTAEDIERSGAVDLPDLFRMVPGVDVIAADGCEYGLSARGFNSIYASRMLVMIDYRTIYTSFFGGVVREVGPVEFTEASLGTTEPEISGIILLHRSDIIMDQTFISGKIREVDPVIFANARKGAKPQVSVLIFHHGKDDVIKKAGVCSVMGERSAIVFGYPAGVCAKPQMTSLVFDHGVNAGRVHPLGFVQVFDVLGGIILERRTDFLIPSLGKAFLRVKLLRIFYLWNQKALFK